MIQISPRDSSPVDVFMRVTLEYLVHHAAEIYFPLPHLSCDIYAHSMSRFLGTYESKLVSRA